MIWSGKQILKKNSPRLQNSLCIYFIASLLIKILFPACPGLVCGVRVWVWFYHKKPENYQRTFCCMGNIINWGELWQCAILYMKALRNLLHKILLSKLTLHFKTHLQENYAGCWFLHSSLYLRKYVKQCCLVCIESCNCFFICLAWLLAGQI